MPILSGVSGNALASLTSIDDWINTLNSTVAGAAKTGFKASHITFGGGATDIERLAQNGALGIQFAEQALDVAATSVDFSQGQVVASTEFTHMALSGSNNAFFVLCDTIDSTNYPPVPLAATTGVGATPGARFYVTRNGEFHRDKDGNLVNQDGLFLVGAKNDDGLTTGSAATQTQVIVNLAGDPTNPNETIPDPEVELGKMIDNHNLGTADVGGTSAFYDHRIAHTFINDLQGLKFSKYGSSVFEMADPSIIPALSDADGTNSANPSQSQLVKITGTSLEASNVQLPSTLVELALAQKIYSALTKVIQIDQQKLDSILNLIR